MDQEKIEILKERAAHEGGTAVALVEWLVKMQDEVNQLKQYLRDAAANPARYRDTYIK